MIYMRKCLKIILAYLFLQQFIALNVAINYGKLCKEHVPVRRTRIVWRHTTQMITKRNWLGMRKVTSVPHTYTEQEFYNDYEQRSKCCWGYKEHNGMCEPICGTQCPKYGVCIRPNSCVCNEGYDFDSSGACIPICTNACSDNSTCTAPEKCTCNEGYAAKSNGVCEPICSDNCPANSYCYSPNTCKCNSGYENEGITNVSLTCKPVCESGCPKLSSCTAPGKCTCSDGYRAQANGACEPICRSSCPENSTCTAPDKCSCNDGYATKANGACEPICSLACPDFSSCVAPEYCKCAEGYRMNKNQTLCEPLCLNGCPEFSTCLRPGYCQCDIGYELKPLLATRNYCAPICEMDCTVLGKCVRPGICECLEGYELRNDTVNSSRLCQPHCSKHCQNGFCAAPEICLCNPGYLMEPNGTCVPNCSMSCVNGSCTEPEICTCDLGYRLQQNSLNICEPICVPACRQADCVAPDVCKSWNFDENRLQDFTNETEINFEGVSTLYYSTAAEVSGTAEEQDITIKYSTDYENSAMARIKEIALDRKMQPNEVTTQSTDSTHHTIQASITQIEKVDFISELLVDTNCDALCNCWIETDEFGIINTAKCEKICSHEHDQTCLNIALCHCDIQKLKLFCNNTEDSLEDTMNTYECHMTSSTTTTLHITTTMESVHVSVTEKQINSKATVWWTIASLFVVLVVVAGLIGWRIVRNNQVESDYDVVCLGESVSMRA